ncbi:MAG: macro domain-containing protein [Gammaproteobacteria bacterium]|nr:macro domain-containing protein [Gammaproteobacteria bacterium]MDD9896201.1 macro domain-containing protein [Gammaproteobacteria bacterium]
MIYEVEGDIMLSRAQVLVQGVSIRDPMTRGIGRKLHERYPAMVEAYGAWCEETNPEPGEIWSWLSTDNLTIVNLITHEGDDDPSRVGRPGKIAVNRAFRRLNKLSTDQRFKSMAMPKIASGQGGLDWVEVRGMMDSQLGELLFPIFIYLVELDGQVASEPGM